MKKISILFGVIGLIAFSCSKDKNEQDQSQAVFEAELNGINTGFIIESAALFQSGDMGQKRMDINCVSPDKSVKFILTFTESPETGNGMSIRNYTVRFGIADDPTTPDVDEGSPSFEALMSYGVKVEDRFVFDPYSQRGVISVISCDAGARSISGTFEARLKKLSGGDEIILANGKFSNIRYMLLKD